MVDVLESSEIHSRGVFRHKPRLESERETTTRERSGFRDPATLRVTAMGVAAECYGLTPTPEEGMVKRGYISIARDGGDIAYVRRRVNRREIFEVDDRSRGAESDSPRRSRTRKPARKPRRPEAKGNHEHSRAGAPEAGFEEPTMPGRTVSG